MVVGKTYPTNGKALRGHPEAINGAELLFSNVSVQMHFRIRGRARQLMSSHAGVEEVGAARKIRAAPSVLVVNHFRGQLQ